MLSVAFKKSSRAGAKSRRWCKVEIKSAAKDLTAAISQGHGMPHAWKSSSGVVEEQTILG